MGFADGILDGMPLSKFTQGVALSAFSTTTPDNVCVGSSKFVPTHTVCCLSTFLCSSYGSIRGGRFSNNIEIGQTHICPVNDCVYLDPRNISKISRNMPNSIYTYFSCATLISLLYSSCRPLAVFWSVIKIIIDSIKGGTFRLLPHIFNKLLKIIYPLRADLYSSATIIFVLLKFWIVTATLHFAPNNVKRMLPLKRHVWVLPLAVGIGNAL